MLLLTLNDEVDDGVGPASLVDQTGVLSVIVVPDGEELEGVGLRVERHPVLVVPDDHGVVAVLDQFDGRRFAVQSTAGHTPSSVGRR